MCEAPESMAHLDFEAPLVELEERIAAEDMAGWCGTIAYEILARIAEPLPRIRVESQS